LVECVQKGRPPDLTPEHALHVLEIMICAQQAGREGRFVDVTSTMAAYQFSEPPQEAKRHRIHDRTRE
jgi:hypothetical protein